MHFCNTFDGNSASNFKRQCDFFQLSEVAFWSGVLFEYIQAPGVAISLLSNWQTQTSTIRNGFVIELKQKGGACKSIYISEIHSFSGASSVALGSVL